VKRIHLFVLFLLAFIVRALIISRFGQEPGADHIWNDAVAWNLVQGHGFTASQSAPYVPGVFRSPGYPAFLAFLFAVFGHSFKAAFLANALLDSITTVFVTLIVAKLSSVEHALLSGALYALYPYPAIFCGMLIQDTLLTFAVISVLLVLVSDTRWKWPLLGVLLGLTALIKPFLILFSAVPLVFTRKWRRAVVMMAVTVLTISPWVLRNYVTFHAFPPLSVGGTGENLGVLIAEMNGGEKATLAKWKSDSIMRAGYKYTPDKAAEYLDTLIDGRPLIELERQRVGEYAPIIRHRWREYISIVVRHLWRNWVTMNVGSRGKLAVLAFALTASVFALGLLGMWLQRKQWRQFLPLYLAVFWITLIYAPYSQESRYLLPARPAMIVFVAGALLTLLRRRSGSLSHAVSQVHCSEPLEIENTDLVPENEEPVTIEA
jgi:4-amino-4-deoxy-L-arabinose transferase-like glycosyltransferase